MKLVQFLIWIFHFYNKTSAGFFFVFLETKPESCFFQQLFSLKENYQKLLVILCCWWIILFIKLMMWIRNPYWYHSLQFCPKYQVKPLLSAYYKKSLLISNQCVLSCLYAGFKYHRVVSSHPCKQYSEDLLLAETPSISVIYYKLLLSYI